MLKRAQFINLTDSFVHGATLRASFCVNIIKILFLLLYLKLFRRHSQVLVISKVLHLGDIIACEPVAQFYRDKYPDAFIVWCVEKRYRELIDSNPLIDYTLAVECIIEWQWFTKLNLFEYVVDLHINNRICKKCNKAYKKKYIDSELTYENYYNYGTLLEVFCRAGGIQAPEFAPQVFIGGDIQKRIEKYGLGDSYLTVHCLSNEHSRDWDPCKWEQLLTRINASFPEIKVVEVGMASFLGNRQVENYVNLCGKLSILESAAVIRSGKIFLGIDSGPAHLANAVRVKSLILMGEYKTFAKYMPYTGFFADSPLVRILQNDGPLSELSVENVWKELVPLLDTVSEC